MLNGHLMLAPADSYGDRCSADRASFVTEFGGNPGTRCVRECETRLSGATTDVTTNSSLELRISYLNWRLELITGRRVETYS